jgi:hypothetical protein
VLIWILVVLLGAAAVCFFVDAAKPQAWSARGLFLVALALFIYMLNAAL